MTTSDSTKPADTSLGRDLLGAARYYLGTRRAIAVSAIVAAPVGVGFGWNWLVAAGIAPILLTALPCLVMCGFGLCMNKLIGGSGSNVRTTTGITSSIEQAGATNASKFEPRALARAACCHALPDDTTSTAIESSDQRRETHA